MQDLMAMFKGKGKGTVECYNCGKTGHMAKDCWAPKKGKGDYKGGKGYPSYPSYGPSGKGDQKGGKGYPPFMKGKGYGKGTDGNGKGGPKGGCYNCGGAHYAADCPKTRSGVNGVGSDEAMQAEVPVAESVNFGGGKGDQANVEWDYQQAGYAQGWFDLIEYDGGEWVKVASKQSQCKHKHEHECVNTESQALGHVLNVKGEWERITFTGDSGAVDHVITQDAAKAFSLIPTAASKAGLSYRAANG
jgi:hypothetical protein